MIRHWWYIKIYSASNLGYTVKVRIPKNKYTKEKNTIYTYLYSLNDDGSERTDLEPVKITLYYVGEAENKLIFQTETASDQGKPMIFVNEPTYHNWNNNWSYVIATDNGYFKAITPHEQF